MSSGLPEKPQLQGPCMAVQLFVLMLVGTEIQTNVSSEFLVSEVTMK